MPPPGKPSGIGQAQIPPFPVNADPLEPILGSGIFYPEIEAAPSEYVPVS